MKVQVPDFTENSTQFERDPFHFLTSLTQKRNYARKTVSFFNELDTGREPCSQVVVSFFNELDTGSGTMLITVSFFNELDTGREPCS